MIRVSASSRLHFGLFSLPAAESAGFWPDLDGRLCIPARSLGGVGLMVAKPGISVSAATAKSWSAAGPLAGRALGYAQKVVQALNSEQAFHIAVDRAPAEHVGLGTGTQLGLAVARVIASALHHPELDASDLARMIGRGQRSALGIHGFAHGGFLVDGGKRLANAIAPLVARHAFPDAWRVVLIVPIALQGDHGEREAEAFRSLSSTKPDIRRLETLSRLVLLGMLPALVERDLDAFGEALHDFNRHVGEMFRPWQRDLYAHPTVAGLVRLLRDEGVRGVGQSSWGPAVFAVTTADRATWLAERLIDTRRLVPEEVMVVEAANAGAQVECADL